MLQKLGEVLGAVGKACHPFICTVRLHGAPTLYSLGGFHTRLRLKRRQVLTWQQSTVLTSGVLNNAHKSQSLTPHGALPFPRCFSRHCPTLTQCSCTQHISPASAAEEETGLEGRRSQTLASGSYPLLLPCRRNRNELSHGECYAATWGCETCSHSDEINKSHGAEEDRRLLF